jgi:hypothetical protein
MKKRTANYFFAEHFFDVRRGKNTWQSSFLPCARKMRMAMFQTHGKESFL